MTDLNQIYLARQPIFNKNMGVYAYEILFRSAENSDHADITDGTQATAQVMSNLLNDFGIESIVGEKKAFINFNEELLLQDIQSFLPKKQVVLEILKCVNPTDEIKEKFTKLTKKGYRLALDDYDFNDRLSPFEEHCDIIKVDILAAGPRKIIENMQRLKNKDKRLIAVKIESIEQFNFCKEVGFDLFQGYFFTKPTLIKGKAPSSNQASLLQFLSSVFNPDIKMQKLSEIISNDVTMSQKLLKMVSLTEASHNISSIHDVVLRLGINKLQSWASVIALTNTSDKPSELLTTSLIRAKFCESIGSIEKDLSKDSYFMVGLFSTLDTIMDQPLDEILSGLSFKEEIKSALLNKTGNLGKALATVKNIESGKNDFIPPAGLTPSEVTKIYLEAMEFTNKLNIKP